MYYLQLQAISNVHSVVSLQCRNAAYKPTQFKMLRRNLTQNKIHFKCNSQLHSQPGLALLLVSKHVSGMFTLKDTC